MNTQKKILHNKIITKSKLKFQITDMYKIIFVSQINNKHEILFIISVSYFLITCC